MHCASSDVGGTPPLLFGLITAIGASYSSEPQAAEYHLRVLARVSMILSSVCLFPASVAWGSE